MNYFLSNLFHDRKVFALLGLSALAGLNIMDFLSFMLLGNGFFNLWVIKLTIAAAVVGGLAYGYYLHRLEKRSRRLDGSLPAFIAERHAHLAKMAAEDPEFQTFCHECRYFDHNRLRCLLRLYERKAWIKLNDDSLIRHCLYWNLEDQHPVMKLTGRLKKEANETQSDPNEGPRAAEEVESNK